jgi:Mrp family chromosome partitioning ATPase
MAKMMNIPVLALVENMSYVLCPECKHEHSIFGKSHIEAIAKKHGVNTVARMPLDPRLAAASDAGTIELFDGDWLDGILDEIEKL